MKTMIRKYNFLFRFEFVGLFVLIYTSNDTLLFGTNIDYRYVLVRYLSIFFIIIWGALKKNTIYHSSRECFLMFILLFFLFIINSCVSGFHVGFLYNLLLYFTALMYCRHVSVHKFLKTYQLIILILASYSVTVYIVNFLYPSIFNIFPMCYNSEGFAFRNIYLSMIFENLQIRNFGIFREPGVYMIYLNLALFFELFSNSPSIKKSLIYLTAIATTISTAGLAIAFIILLGFGIFSRRYKILLGILPLCLVLYYIVQEVPYIQVLLFDKVENQTYSSLARMASLQIPLNIIYNNPLGSGPEVYNSLFLKISSIKYGISIDPRDSTNTLLKFLAVYGPFVFIYITYFIYKFSQTFSKKTLVNLFLFFIIIIASSNEDLRDSILIYLILSYGVTYSLSKSSKKAVLSRSA